MLRNIERRNGFVDPISLEPSTSLPLTTLTPIVNFIYLFKILYFLPLPLRIHRREHRIAVAIGPVCFMRWPHRAV